MKKKFILVWVIFCVILALTSCSVNNSDDKTNISNETIQEDNEIVERNSLEFVIDREDARKTVIYYMDSKGYIVPVMRLIPKEEAIAYCTLLALIDNNENRLDIAGIGLKPTLPDGIEFELNLGEDGLLKVNFNDAILKINNKEDELAAIQSIIYTLTEFETVDSIQIMVDNKIIDTLSNGMEIKEPLKRNNINTLGNYVNGEFSKITLYVYNNITGDYTYYFPVTKNISNIEKTIEGTVEEFLHINSLSNYKINVPEGLVLISSLVQEDTLYLTFSEELNKIDEVEFERFKKALVLTLKEFVDIQRVKIIIDADDVQNMNIDTITIPAFANYY